MKKIKILIIGAVVFSLILAALPSINANNFSKEQSFKENNENDWFVSGEVIVKFKDEQIIARSTSLVKSYGGLTVKQTNQLLDIALVEVEKGEELNFIQKIITDPQVEYAEPNGYVYITDYEPNDPMWDRQWGPSAIKCDKAWESLGKGSKDVLLAIVDTGVDYTHEDIKKNYVAKGYDWVNLDDDPMDDNTHGTHCAGIAAGVMDNTKGITGVAQVSIMAEKVLSAYGEGTWFHVAAGVSDAVKKGADVISMSLGSSVSSKVLKDACDDAWSNNVVVVAASGNDGTSVSYPAAYDSVIAVGAVNPSLERTWWSNYGPELELVAPGEDILSCVLGNDYEFYSGTSMACPHVAGVAALVKSIGYTSNNEIRQIMKDTAIDLGAEGKDNYYGYGLVDASLNGFELPGKYQIYVAVHQIKGLDPIDVWPDADPEWYYHVKVITNNEEMTQTNYNLKTIPKQIMESSFWESEWISENVWRPEAVHKFYVNEPIVTIKICLKEADIMFYDTADISSDPNRRTLIMVYDIENRTIVENLSDEVHQTSEWYIADGELDGYGGDEDDAGLWFMIAGKSDKAPKISDIIIDGDRKVGETLKFNGVVSGGKKPYKWFWNFGDGSSSSLEKPEHSYKKHGSYVVTAAVMDSQNLSSEAFYYLVKIKSEEVPVIVEFTGDKQLEKGQTGTYKVSAVDPNSLDVLYGWDWDGDDIVDEWTDVYKSGEKCYTDHKWNTEGTFTIKVKARNIEGLESDFKSMSVSVPRSKEIYRPYAYQILERLFNRFPLFAKFIDLAMIDF